MTQFNPADQAATVDAIIRRNRAATGAAASGLRTRPRMTVAEMNQADPDELRDKFLSDQFDDRGPITKALDLLDLPRNTIVNIAAGRPTVKGVAGAAGGSVLGGAAIGALAGAALGGVGAIPGALAGAATGAGLFGAGAAVAGVARAAGAAEGMSDIVDTLPTGAADQPTVMGADLLKGMGIENGVARGLLGFGLDVAFDPLTYAGPPGWGVNSGRVALRGGAKAVVKSGLREAAGGAARVGNTEIRAMLKAGGLTDEAAMTGNDLAKLWHGDSTMTKTDKVFRLLGGEEASSGGLLDKLFYTPLTEGMDPTLREGALAARKFVDKYGRGTRGMAIRGGGSEIAHVPFTDIALSVPGFTSEGQRTVAQLRHAKDLRNAAPATPAMLRAADQLNLAREAADTVRASREELSAKRSEWDRRRADLPPDPPPGAAPPAPSPSGPGPGGLPPAAGSPDDVPPTPAPTDGGLDMSPGAMADRSAQELRDALSAAKPIDSLANGTTPPQSELDRFIGESREAFKNLPPEDLDAGSALFRATVKGIAKRLNKTEEEIAAMLRAQKGDAAGGALNQPAWHGSKHVFGIDDSGAVVDPHAMSLDHIGTGEGGQYRGYGHYAAQSDKVAESYRNLALRDLMLDGMPIHEDDLQRRIVALIGSEARHDSGRIARLVVSDLRSGLDPRSNSIADNAGYLTKDERESLLDLIAGVERPPAESGIKIRSGKGPRAMSKLRHQEQMDLFDIEGRLAWARGKTADEKWASVNQDLASTMEAQRENADRIRADAAKWGIEPRALDSDESAQVVANLHRVLAEAGLPDEILDAADAALRHWHANGLLGDGTISMSKIESYLEHEVKRDIRNLESPWKEGGEYNARGAQAALGKVFTSEAWLTAGKQLDGPSIHARLREAAETFRKAERQLALIRDNDLRAVFQQKPGAMYKLDIKPTDDELLHFDTGFNQQPQAVKDAVTRIFDEMGGDVWKQDSRGVDTWYRGFNSPKGYGVGATISKLQDGTFVIDAGGMRTAAGSPTAATLDEAMRIGDELAAQEKARAFDTSTGYDIYKAISNALGQKHGAMRGGTTAKGGRLALEMGANDKMASELLLKHGVRGNKFLDGGSRASGSGTYNFVIFDDADVKIEEVLRQMNRGAFWQDGSKRVIAAMESPDLSTMVHELGHAIRSFLPDDELAIVTRVYKMDADLWGAKLNQTAKGLNRREAEEKFAKDFERYCATGQLPEGIDEESRTLLTKAFESIKEFLLDLYKNIVGTPLEDRLHPEIKGVFDRMLGGVGVEAKKAGKGPGSFTRADMESQILSAAERLPGNVEANWGTSEAVADDSGTTGLSTLFYKKLPAEVKDFINGRPHLKFQFNVTDNPGKAKGEDVASALGWDEYFKQVEGNAMPRLERAKQIVRGGGPDAEQARLAAWMHDVTPRGPVKLDKYINPAALADGTEFTIFGHPFAVNTGTDGVRVAMGDTDAFRLDAIETLPFDPGSMQGGIAGTLDPAWTAGGGSPIEDDLPVSPLWQRTSKARGGDVAGQEGMFGQGTYGAGGEQGSLFGQGGSPAPAPTPAAAADDVPVPVRMVNETDAEYKARLAMHAKWKESARNTGRLFQSAPDPIETRSAIDAEQAAYEQSHRAAMDAAIVAARERLFTIKEEMANLTPAEGANTNTILKFADMRAEAAAAADLVAADKLEFEAAARTRSAVNADINKRIVSQSETLTRLDGYEGTLLRGENGGLMVNSDPAVQTRAFEKARVLMDEIESAKSAMRSIDTATEAGKAEREAALATIKAMQENLLDTTAPLREGTLQSSDDFIETLRDRHMQNLNDEAKRLWELADVDPEGLDALIEATSAHAEAAKKYYDVIGGTIDAHRTPEFESLHELVKMALGTSDSVVAHSLLGSFRSAVSNIFGDNARGVSEKLANLDAAGRKLFGARRGSASHDLAQLHANMTRDPMVTATNMLADVHAELDKAMRSANVPMGLVDDVGPLLHLYVYQAAAEKTGQAWDNVFHLKSVKNGKFVDGEMKLALESLEKKFAQNGADFPKLRDSLKQIAAEQVAQIDNLGDAAQQDYLLSFLSPSHVPLAVSQRAQAGLDTKRMAAAFNNAPVGVGPGGSPREGFQHARTTHVYQFTDPVTGEAREFLEKDLWVWGMTDGQLAKLKAENPAAWKRAMAVRESVEMYKRLPNPPPPRPADPWRLNAMVRDGAFDPLNPGDEVPFFETSWPKVFARTTAMHQRAHARQDIVRFMRTHSLNVPENVRVEVLGKHGQMGSKSFTLPNGETIAIGGTMNKNGSIVSRVTARGRSYRYLDPKMLAYDDNPLLAGITDGIRDIMLPEELADLVENHVRVLNDENIGGVLDAIEKATSLFRQTTLFHPSWTISNIIGNFANAAAGDIPLSGLVKNLGTVAKVRMYRHNPEVLKGIKATIGGREYSGPELLALFDKNRMFNDHQPAVEVALLSRSGHVKLPSETSRLPAGQGLKMDLLSGAAQWGKGDQLKAMGTWGSLPWNRIHRQVLTPWFKANGVVEDSFRGAALLARMEQGDDVLAAQKAVQRALFNYADMTQFEQRYMRTAFPFYAWMRNNLAYQFETLLRRPGYIAAVPKTQRAIEEMLAGESRVPPEMRPQWMRSALATQIGSDPDSRFAAVLGQTIPQAELFQVLQGLTGTEGAMDLMKSYVSQLNPVGMVIPQLAARTEFYSGRSIGPDAESGDISAGEFVTGMARPFSEFGMGGKVSRAFDRGAGQGIARSVLGGRVQAFDQDRIETTKLREFKDKENGIRKSIARMDRRGESTLSARASLMRLYDRMVELGFEKDVPVWAREQRLAMREAP